MRFLCGLCPGILAAETYDNVSDGRRNDREDTGRDDAAKREYDTHPTTSTSCRKPHTFSCMNSFISYSYSNHSIFGKNICNSNLHITKHFRNSNQNIHRLLIAACPGRAMVNIIFREAFQNKTVIFILIALPKKLFSL